MDITTLDKRVWRKNWPFFAIRDDHKQKKMMLSATIIQLMMQIQPVLELSQVET